MRELRLAIGHLSYPAQLQESQNLPQPCHLFVRYCERPYPSSKLLTVLNAKATRGPSHKASDSPQKATCSHAVASSLAATVSAGASVTKFSLFCVPIGVMGHVSVAAAKMHYRAFISMTWVVENVMAGLRRLHS